MNEILKKRIEEAAVEHAESIPQSDERKEYSREDFIAGAEYALSCQWIRIDESLPKKFVDVIVAYKYGSIGISHVDGTGTFRHNDVMFWMSIPKFNPDKPNNP